MSVPEGYKSLGKIGISYKGDYNSNTAYERLDAVFHNGSTYLAIKDAPDGAPRDDKTNWIYLAKGYDGETVDVADSEIAFTDSETRENIVSGEKVSTVFGKIKKFFTDLTAPAFAQMITSADDLLATKVTGYVPDAKAVADGFADVNGKLDNVSNQISIGEAKVMCGVWGYDGNAASPFLLVPISLYDTNKYTAKASYVTIQGIGQYNNELSLSMWPGSVCIYTSDVKGNSYNGRLGIASLTIYKK